MQRHVSLFAFIMLACVLCSGSAAFAQGSEVQLRGGKSSPPGGVSACTPEGVVIASALTGKIVIGWDRVRTVTGEHAEEARAYADIADKSWRAVSRLERGDIPAAEPLFEELFADYAGSEGPTAAAIAGGLLRCRLDRGAHTLAVAAWLAWLHADTPGSQLDSSNDVRDVLMADPETGLVPELPPIWLDLPAVRVFGQSPLNAERYGDRAAQLAMLYQLAATTESGKTQPMPRLDDNDAGVRLVWDLVAAQSRDEAERLVGRKAIEKRLRADPVGWTDAWLRTALGRSLLREADPDEQRRGVIELLRVRVTHERDAPYLAGLALAEAAVTMQSLGDADAASLLRRELLDSFPGHPATTWEPISLWQDAASASRQHTEPNTPHVLPPLRTAADADDAHRPIEQSRSPHG